MKDREEMLEEAVRVAFEEAGWAPGPDPKGAERWSKGDKEAFVRWEEAEGWDDDPLPLLVIFKSTTWHVTEESIEELTRWLKEGAVSQAEKVAKVNEQREQFEAAVRRAYWSLAQEKIRNGVSQEEADAATSVEMAAHDWAVEEMQAWLEGVVTDPDLRVTGWAEEDDNG